MRPELDRSQPDEPAERHALASQRAPATGSFLRTATARRSRSCSPIAIFAALLALLGANPWDGFQAIWNGALGNKFNFGQTVMITEPPRPHRARRGDSVLRPPLERRRRGAALVRRLRLDRRSALTLPSDHVALDRRSPSSSSLATFGGAVWAACLAAQGLDQRQRGDHVADDDLHRHPARQLRDLDALAELLESDPGRARGRPAPEHLDGNSRHSRCSVHARGRPPYLAPDGPYGPRLRDPCDRPQSKRRPHERDADRPDHDPRLRHRGRLSAGLAGAIAVLGINGALDLELLGELRLPRNRRGARRPVESRRGSFPRRSSSRRCASAATDCRPRPGSPRRSARCS